MYEEFLLCAVSSILLWIASAICSHRTKSRSSPLLTSGLAILGIIILLGFVTSLWINLGRPPLRTLGETRLWYAILLSLSGLVIGNLWRLTWLRTYSLLLATVFLSLNIIRPDNFDRSLMPALQSPWFIPHVIVYMEAYALLTASALVALRGLIMLRRGDYQPQIIISADKIVLIGYVLLSLGMIFGALWAKVAWGHYWSWDPKEVWALLTWLSYLIYLHLRVSKRNLVRLPLYWLCASFVILLLCWFGVNYLPAVSIHSY